MEDSHVVFKLEKAFLGSGFVEGSSYLINLNVSDDIKGIAGLIIAGKFTEVLQLKDFEELRSFSNIQLLNDCVLRILSSNDFSISSQFQVFSFGVASLQLFVEANWLGIKERDVIKGLDIEEIEKALILDGECLLPTVKSLHHLLVAKCILHDLRDKLSDLKLSKWWLLRYLYIHQRVLEEPSQLLNCSFQKDIEQSDFANTLEDDEISILLHTEMAYFHHLYGEVQKAKECFQKAQATAQFSVEWQGALGKRTRYQQEAIAQMTVKVHSTKVFSDQGRTNVTVEELPKDLQLDDDTRLNKILFLNEVNNIMPELQPIHQALLVGLVTQMEKTMPRDELMVEEVIPLLNCILAYPKVWSIHVSALLLRSKFESDRSRTVERSMLQMQELTESLERPLPLAEVRAEYFYVSRMPLERELHGMLADLQLSLGAVNSALDLYLRLEMWEKVIACYQLLEMKHKAEEIVRQELAKKPSPKLWCILGDCTDNVQCYQTAWELSNGSSARAQRDWAFYYYRKKQYRESIPHFQKSLGVNSLQEGVWMRLAFVAGEIEEWETAASAYRRYCALNSDSFEAWNNLAQCYVKLRQKNRAWKALQEAIKCNYDNWKVWDNLMVVSVDCGEFEEVIKSYHRILDLKEKHIDTEALGILVRAITENREDSCGLPASRLAPAAHKLFGRLTSQVVSNAQVWEIYADLIANLSEPDESDKLFRVTQTLQKAYRSAVMMDSWEKDVQVCCTTLKLCIKFADSCLACLGCVSVSKEMEQLVKSARLSLRSAISQVKRCYDFEMPSNVSSEIESLGQKVSSIDQMLFSSTSR